MGLIEGSNYSRTLLRPMEHRRGEEVLLQLVD